MVEPPGNIIYSSQRQRNFQNLPYPDNILTGDITPPEDTYPNNTPSIISPINDTRFLELINETHSISNGPDAGSIVPAWPGVSVSATDITLNETAREAVIRLFEAAEAEQAGSFYLTSGYRSYDEQAQIYKEISDKSLVQLPGCSEHQTGLAADIMAKGIGQFELANSPEGKWLAENSWRYGLILRYEEDKRNITGIAGEAWHFRYVGQPHARYCYENDMCLEEYIEFLQESGGYTIQADGTEYTVTYYISEQTTADPASGTANAPALPEDKKIPPPNGAGYEISGDNAGGYIITSY